MPSLAMLDTIRTYFVGVWVGILLTELATLGPPWPPLLLAVLVLGLLVGSGALMVFLTHRVPP